MTKQLRIVSFLLLTLSSSNIWAQLYPSYTLPKYPLEEALNETSQADIAALAEHQANVPFGANLFAQVQAGARHQGLSGSYMMTPGDQIALHLWGATNVDTTLTIDNTGNIFIPSIGPVRLAGKTAEQVQPTIAAAVKSIYTNDVNVYTSILNPTPISVFVTGHVIAPGQYAGLPTDSLLYFLKQAQGIDLQAGSFRSLTVLRNNYPIANIDLYDFLLKGTLSKLQLFDGDTIYVNPIGHQVTVESGAIISKAFELTSSTIGSQVIAIANPESDVSHVEIIGTRHNKPYSNYLTLTDFANTLLTDGDTIKFIADTKASNSLVHVTGASLNESTYPIKNGDKLYSLLARVKVNNDLADIKNIKLMRKSVAARQKQQIEDSLRRLERSVLTNPVSSTGDAAIRSHETQMVMQYVNRARQYEPLGNVVVSKHSHISDILLEDGDVIVIPAKSDVIIVSGEVSMPQTLVHSSDYSIADYIEQSGGFTDRANSKRVAILHPSGELTFIEGSKLNSQQIALTGGDQILVFPEVDTKVIQSIKDITQIIYQIAVAANVVSK